MSRVGDKRTNAEDDGAQFTDEQIQALENNQKEFERIELALERQSLTRLDKFYGKRRTILSGIPNFWQTAMRNHVLLSETTSLPDDQKALSFLEDIHVVRDPKEHRAYTIEFHFAQNPFFAETVLKKEYKYIPPSDAAVNQPDEDGVSDALVNFDLKRDTEPSTIQINWKEPAKALTKLYPRVLDPEDEDSVEDQGSFFNIFEHADPDADIENAIAFDLYPSVVDYFFNRGENSLGTMGVEDEEDEEDEEDGSDEDEIDLENPKKKAKN